MLAYPFYIDTNKTLFNRLKKNWTAFVESFSNVTLITRVRFEIKFGRLNIQMKRKIITVYFNSDIKKMVFYAFAQFFGRSLYVLFYEYIK